MNPRTRGGVAEAHFGLGRMDVDVDFLGRELEEQRQHRVAVAREHLGISAAHRADQQPVLHRAAVDEQVLVVGDAAVEGRQAGDRRSAASSPRCSRSATPLSASARSTICAHAGREPFPALQAEHAPPVVLEA